MISKRRAALACAATTVAAVLCLRPEARRREAASDTRSETPSSLEEISERVRRGDHGEARRLARDLLRTMEASGPAASFDVAAVLEQLADAVGGGARDPEEMAIAARLVRAQQTGRSQDPLALSRSLGVYGRLLLESERYERARTVLERAHTIRVTELGPCHIEVAESLRQLADLRWRMGDYDSARRLLTDELALRIHLRGSVHEEVADSLNFLAILQLESGAFAEAKHLHQQALEMRERLFGSDSIFIAQSLNNLGVLLRVMGDFAAARPLQERALSIAEKQLGAKHPSVGKCLDNLALVYEEEAQPERAYPLLERSLAIRQEALGASDPTIAESLGRLASLDRGLGRRPLARRRYERAIEISRATNGDGHPKLADLLADLAALHHDQGEDAIARELYASAVGILEKTLPPTHPLLAVKLEGLSGVLLAGGDATGALETALRAAAMSREHVRLTIGTLSEHLALRHSETKSAGLEVAIAVAQARPSAASASAAWDAVIRWRGLVMDEMTARRQLVFESGDRKVAARASELTRANDRLANLLVRGLGSLSPDAYRRLVEDSRRQREEAEEALARVSLAHHRRGDPGLEDVRVALPPESALVAFVRSGEPLQYAAFVLRHRGEPSLVPLGPAAQIEDCIARWRQALTASPDRREAEDAFRRTAAELRGLVWEPLVPHLADARLVFVVPDGSLHLVNLDALPEASGWRAESGPAIHYLSAERDLTRLTEQPIRVGQGLLAVGGIDFDAPLSAPIAMTARLPERRAVAGSEVGGLASGSSAATRASLESLRFTPLPATGPETEEIISIYRKSARGEEADRTVLLSGGAASESALKTIASGKRIVHLASHRFEVSLGSDPARPRAGTRSLISPWRTALGPTVISGLALSGANHREDAGAGSEDGIWTTEEMSSMDLSGVEWVVLSACETGLGEITRTEGVLGLRRALHIAGARTVVMSLWKVDDESTRAWMVALYQNRLGRGADTAESVRQASLAVLRARRAKGVSTHPYFWAGFVASGDWR